MIKTKAEQQTERELRNKLEDITMELVKLWDELDKVEIRIMKLPYDKLDRLKGLTDDKFRIKSRMDYLEEERRRFINLLNIKW